MIKQLLRLNLINKETGRRYNICALFLYVKYIGLGKASRKWNSED